MSKLQGNFNYLGIGGSHPSIRRLYAVAAIFIWLSVPECFGQKALLTIVDNKCVTNSWEAMAAIYNLDQITHEFVEGSDEDNSETICETLQDCSKDPIDITWTKNISTSYLITDRRWEKLPVVTWFGKSQISSENNDFELPFSLQMADKAHVLLCTGAEWIKSFCYWFQLNSRHTSNIQICKSCDWTKHEYHKEYTESSKWYHFKIIKENKQLMLNNGSGSVLVSKTIADDFKPKYLFFRNGIGRIHRFNYSLSNTDDSGKTTDITLNASIGKNKLSMFVRMCVECMMEITIYTTTTTSKKTLESKVLFTQDTTWRMETFDIDVGQTNLHLQIKKIRAEALENPDYFWALSDIRISTREGLRTLIPEKDSWTKTCQLLNSNLELAMNYEKPDELESWDRCEDNEFGEDCFSNSSIFPYKEQLGGTRYCQLLNSSGIINQRCYCSSGYQGSNCQRKCNKYQYGHSCKKSCKKCADYCDHISGECDGGGCKDNYEGSQYCKQPFGLFLFNNHPEIRIGKGRCELVFNDFSGIGNASMIKYYRIVYFKSWYVWTNYYYGTSYWWPSDFTTSNLESKPFKIPNLESGKKYKALAFGVINEENKNPPDMLKIVRHITFTAGCEEPEAVQDLLVTSKGPNYISLRWRQPAFSWQLEYQINIIKSDTYTTSSNQIKPRPCALWKGFYCATLQENLIEKEIYHLEIVSNYKGYLCMSKKQDTEAITTQESTPESPNNLCGKWTDNNELIITWYHPNSTNGILTSFSLSVNYKNGQRFPLEYKIASENEYMPFYEEHVKDNLQFPNKYTITVKAHNVAGESAEVSRDFESPPPIPQYSVKEIQTINDSIRITFKISTFSKEFGIFLYVFKSECEICNDNLTTLVNQIKDHHKLNDYIMCIQHTYWDDQNWTYCAYQNELNYQEELFIKNRTSCTIHSNIKYNLALIWVHKHAGYVRTMVEFRPSSYEEEENNDLAGIIISIVCFLTITTTLALVFWKFRNKIFDSTRNLLGPGLYVHPRIYFWRRSAIPTEPTYVNQEEVRDAAINLQLDLIKEIIPCPGEPKFKTNHSIRVKIENFEEYVKNAIDNEKLHDQIKTISAAQPKDSNYGALPGNAVKNRYQNIIAYDHTRVVLEKRDGDQLSDYINANYIDGYRHPKAYIATQGPKPETISDFWRMIWQENVSHIIMMANIIEGNRKKVEQYWPAMSEKEIFGDYVISQISTEVFKNFECRKLEVKRMDIVQAEPRQVYQFHFKVWPDHGVPLNVESLVPFMQMISKLTATDFPLVVHCSAGVGRTGTVILCDLCIRMATAERYIDVFAMLEHIRGQRSYLVDNIDQYKLAHLVILNCFNGIRKSIRLNKDFEKSVKNMNNIKTQLKYIRNCEWQDDALKKSGRFADDETPLVVNNKNRFANIIPGKQESPVFLLPYPKNTPSTTSIYINAVKVNGFYQPDKFIVTQYPLPSTIGDFWRLISEKNISVVVCLNEPPINDSTCKEFWPDNNLMFQPVDEINVKHIETKVMEVFSILTFQLSTTEAHQTRGIRIVKFNGWTYPNELPNQTDFIKFINDVTAITKNSPKVLVSCYDGATASGLFIAMTLLFEGIRLEQKFNVCQVVRSIRTIRKQFTNTREQLEFLVNAAVIYSRHILRSTEDAIYENASVFCID